MINNLDINSRMQGYGWYIAVGFGAALMGVGFGIYLSARHFFKAAESSIVFVIVGISTLAAGIVLTQVAHTRYKRIVKGEMGKEDSV